MTNLVDIKVELEDQQITETLERLRLAMGGELADPMREIGRTLLTSLRFRFRDQVNPEGKPWVKSKRVLAHGGQTMRLSGRLRNSFTYRADSHSVAVGTNVAYAPALHFGRSGTEDVKPHSRKVTVVFGHRLSTPVTSQVKGFRRRVNLPARKMIGASAQDRSDMLKIAGHHLFSAIGTH